MSTVCMLMLYKHKWELDTKNSAFDRQHCVIIVNSQALSEGVRPQLTETAHQKEVDICVCGGVVFIPDLSNIVQM